MSRPKAAASGARHLVWLGPVLWTASAVVLGWMAVIGRPLTDKPLADELGLFLSFGGFVLAGTIISWRRPDHAIGWSLSAVGVLAGMVFLGTAYSSVTLAAESASTVGWLVAWWAQLLWMPMLMLALIVLPACFPDGHLPSRRWRPVLWVAGTGLSLYVAAAALGPETYVGETGFGFSVPNRLGVPAFARWADGVEAVGGALLALAVVGAVASLVVRFVRSDADTRRRIGLVVYAIVAAAVSVSVADLLPRVLAVVLTSLSIAAIPVAILIAVTRYQLYEIDRLVNRTLVYATLTVALVAIYALGTITLQVVVRPLTGSSELAVAGSTLAAAGAVAPLHRRIQAAVDRRFDRARYDAARTLEVFAVRLRSSIDLDQLDLALCAVVGSTLQTGTVSLWLRQDRAG